MGSPNLRNTIGVMQGTVVDQIGNIINDPWIKVLDHTGALADLYETYDGDVALSDPLTNPFQGNELGQFLFYTTAGPCTVIWGRNSGFTGDTRTFNHVMLGAHARVDQNNVFEGEQTFNDVTVTGKLNLAGTFGSPSGDLVPKSRQVLTGSPGLEGGGDLSQDRTLSLSLSGVTAGVYNAVDLTVDTYGRVTDASENLLNFNTSDLKDVGSPLGAVNDDVLTWDGTKWVASASDVNLVASATNTLGAIQLTRSGSNIILDNYEFHPFHHGLVFDWYPIGADTDFVESTKYNRRFFITNLGSPLTDPTFDLTDFIQQSLVLWGARTGGGDTPNPQGSPLTPTGVYEARGWSEVGWTATITGSPNYGYVFDGPALGSPAPFSPQSTTTLYIVPPGPTYITINPVSGTNKVYIA